MPSLPPTLIGDDPTDRTRDRARLRALVLAGAASAPGPVAAGYFAQLRQLAGMGDPAR